jgi:hypothetical protein
MGKIKSFLSVLILTGGLILGLNPATNDLYADCKIVIPDMPSMPCLQIWCESTWSYSGCGWGNGLECNEIKSCR